MTTNLTGAPTARRQHTAVWTGTVMVVWGGTDLTPLNTGGRYDPAANAWSSTATAGAPPGRYLHTAVWTGTEMIVWGGLAAAPLASGARYDPAGDSWTLVPASGAPPARYNHTAVWSGAVMLIFGGFDGTYTNSGGRYTPGGAWSPTASAGAPTGRFLHTAVWTGSRMVVWGGEDAADAVNGGGRYDPSGDQWQTLDDTGAPAARWQHAAVWAGHFMIVWGGQDAVAAVSSGGRYALGLQSDDDLDGYSECDGDCDDALASVGPGAPQVCDDGVNNDCGHPSWPALTGTNEVDDDGDGLSECQADCNDSDGGAWAAPGEVTGLVLSMPLGQDGSARLDWDPDPGGSSSGTRYDVLRSTLPGSAAVCFVSQSPDTNAPDAEVPPPGGRFYYLVRAMNACPAGEGTLGTNSSGQPRIGPSCP